jgi:hypothetical protein
MAAEPSALGVCRAGWHDMCLPAFHGCLQHMPTVGGSFRLLEAAHDLGRLSIPSG